VLAAPALAHTAGLIRASHERVDGKGYPDQLSADKIPLGSRIIAICDAFDAMVTHRSYRDAMSTADALAELRRCAGTQFDAELITVFEAVVQDLLSGYGTRTPPPAESAYAPPRAATFVSAPGHLAPSTASTPFSAKSREEEPTIAA
jgi:HD-GYP domain-containing protein (c-di-GMP phosphodiesterase class II)